MHASFGEVLSRGVRAANRSVTGLLLLFLLYGWFQGVSLVVGGAFASDPTIFQVQPGQQPPAELVWMMGYGCISCVWLLVMVFGGPWVAGGILGQLKDRMTAPEAEPGPFRPYASRYYVRLLLLTVVYVGIFLLLYLILMLVGMMIAASVLQGDAMDPQNLQQLNMHPANIAAGALFLLALAAMIVVFNLANAGVVVEEWDAWTSLGRAWGFVRSHAGDAVKLFLVITGLGCVMWSLYWIPAVLELREIPVLAILGLLMAAYFPYMIMLGLAFGVSLWLARRPDVSGAEPTAAEADTPI